MNSTANDLRHLSLLFSATVILLLFSIQPLSATANCENNHFTFLLVERDTGSYSTCVKPNTRYTLEVLGSLSVPVHCIARGESTPTWIYSVPLLSEGFTLTSSNCRDAGLSSSFHIQTAPFLPACGIRGSIAPGCYSNGAYRFDNEYHFQFPECSDDGRDIIFQSLHLEDSISGTCGPILNCSPTPPLVVSETVTYEPVLRPGRVTSTGFYVFFGLDGQGLISRHVGFGETVSCNYYFFGGDPVPGQVKKCYMHTGTDWMRPMADEWGSFTLPPGRTTKTYLRQSLCPSRRPCSNAEFGDPAPYFPKACHYSQSGSSVMVYENQNFVINWEQ